MAYQPPGDASHGMAVPGRTKEICMQPRVPTAVSRASAIAVAVALACAGLAPPASATPGRHGGAVRGPRSGTAPAGHVGTAARRWPGRPGPGGLTQFGPAFRQA